MGKKLNSGVNSRAHQGSCNGCNSEEAVGLYEFSLDDEAYIGYLGVDCILTYNGKPTRATAHQSSCEPLILVATDEE